MIVKANATPAHPMPKIPNLKNAEKAKDPAHLAVLLHQRHKISQAVHSLVVHGMVSNQMSNSIS